MLRFRDKTGKVKFQLSDSDTQPVDVDRLVDEQSKVTVSEEDLAKAEKKEKEE